MIQLLEAEGYKADALADGAEALRFLSNGNQMPDLMLLDLMMPEVDGYQVLEQLRRDFLQEFPVLIVSAKNPDNDILTALDSELRDFVAKPFDAGELLVRIKRLLVRSPRFGAQATGCLRVYTLGTLRVYLDDQLLFDEGWRNKPAKTIFKLLFTHRGRRIPKDALTEELWPEADPDAASNRLRVAIHELRKALGERGRRRAGEGYVGQQEGSYFFNREALCWSDSEAFQDLVTQGQALSRKGDTDEALHAFQRAQAVYQGDYLRDDPFFEWTITTRERLREEYLSMLGEVASIKAATGEPDEAAGFCRRILRVEPWREEVYRKLMQYLGQAGRRNEALRAFEECRRALQAEVETEPSAETKSLRDRIAAGAAMPGE